MKFEEIGKKVIYFGIGLAALTKEKVEEITNELIKTGELKHKEAGDFKEKLMSKAEEEKKEITNFIRTQVKAIAEELGFVTRDEIEKLKNKLEELEKELKSEESQY
ncbi:MAG: hypothetical protein N2440_00290 [Actinobacteria bacterium]|nr:hypothetical protein [Actinomycetota bacterium]